MDLSEWNEVTVTLSDGTSREVLFVVRHPRSDWIFAPKLVEFNEDRLREDATPDDVREKFDEFDIFMQSSDSIFSAQLPEMFELDERLHAQSNIRDIKADRHSIKSPFAFAHTSDCSVPENAFKGILADDRLGDLHSTLGDIKREIEHTSFGPTH